MVLGKIRRCYCLPTDVSHLSIDDGVFATAGDTRLGGEDFDNRVMEYLIKQDKKTSTDVLKNLRASLATVTSSPPGHHIHHTAVGEDSEGGEWV